MHCASSLPVGNWRVELSLVMGMWEWEGQSEWVKMTGTWVWASRGIALRFHCFIGFFIYFLESIANLIVHFVAACILFQIKVQFVCFLSFLIQVWLSQKSKSFFLQMECADGKQSSSLVFYNYRDSSFVKSHLQGHRASTPIFHSTYKAVRICSCNALHLKFVYC